MTEPAGTLDERAREAGIRLDRPGASGDWVPISDIAKERLLAALGSRRYSPDGGTTASCHLPDFLNNGRSWGIAFQLYELRSARNWGIGDFADVAGFCRLAASEGADFVGLNPLHALFMADPEWCSPFSPSNRLYLNPLYLAPDLIAQDATELAEPDELERLRSADLVDYPGVATIKLAVLRNLFDRSGSRDLDQPVAQDFLAQGGEGLRRHALFEALSRDMVDAGHGARWTDWPQEYRDAASQAVADFAASHEGDVRFHLWLQCQAHRQLLEAAEAARSAGMRIGLYLDMAVGEDPGGSATWSDPESFVRGVTVGAPPDVFSTKGQEWGLAALDPGQIERNEGGRFAAMAEAAMQYAGAVRIDHAMALRQLFLVPEEASADDGAYVLYPYKLLVEKLAGSSREHGTIVVGEDLGVVPEGFREDMEQAQILSYRILYFEQRWEAFKPASTYPRLALACLSTHDLPTIRGWWKADDLRLREEHGLVDPESTRQQQEQRRKERRALLELVGLPPDHDDPEEFNVAVHRFIGRTESLLAVARLADLVGELHPTNLPGTSDSYPNWKRKLDIPLEDLRGLELWRSVTRVLREGRPRV